MAKFVFKLGGLLRARERVEQECQRALAVVVAEHQQIKAEADAVSSRIEAEAKQLLENHLVGPINLAYLTSHRRFTTAMRRRAADLAAAVAQAAVKVDVARNALVAAGRDVKVIEKLRERQLARWNAEADRKLTADLDEVSMQMTAARLEDESDHDAEEAD
jgi:flagellar export protein FliJ